MLVDWDLVKGTAFPYEIFFVSRTHFPVQILVNFGGKFFGGNLKGI